MAKKKDEKPTEETLNSLWCQKCERGVASDDAILGDECPYCIERMEAHPGMVKKIKDVHREHAERVTAKKVLERKNVVRAQLTPEEIVEKKMAVERVKMREELLTELKKEMKGSGKPK